jgi:peptide/nickel transport system ATP-binding protein
MTTPILRVENLTMHYTTRKGNVSAVDGVSFTLGEGEALGLVGESGCGKTSIAICLLKLLPDNARITDGHVWVGETDLVQLSNEEMRAYRWKHISMIFQAAMNSLNPVHRVGDQIVEAMQEHLDIMTEGQARERVAELFDLVGIDPAMVDRYPHEFSGGMRQRAVIAMALSCNPNLIIADEPTTALDVIVQDRVLRKLEEIQCKLSMAMIYISHDIAVIAEVCGRIGVMYAGRLAELAPAVDIFEQPLHPYSQALMGSFPSIKGHKKRLSPLPGEPPDLLDPPPGCRFHPRCCYATDRCALEAPPFKEYGDGHYAACWHAACLWTG